MASARPAPHHEPRTDPIEGRSMKWLAKRRFNHVDAIGLIAATSLIGSGHMVAGVMVGVLFVVLGVAVEMVAFGKEEA